jgi:hypothetical protein
MIYIYIISERIIMNRKSIEIFLYTVAAYFIGHFVTHINFKNIELMFYTVQMQAITLISYKASTCMYAMQLYI